MHLESRHLAPGTINLWLGAVRRLAYEAADCGLLSPDLAAGIRRVKGVKKIGVRLGNWLTAEQSQRLWQAPNGERLQEKRDRALLAILLACGLRHHEAVELNFSHIRQREEHRAIVDLKGKAGHTRTIAMPRWVKSALDQWLHARQEASCVWPYNSPIQFRARISGQRRMSAPLPPNRFSKFRMISFPESFPQSPINTVSCLGA